MEESFPHGKILLMPKHLAIAILLGLACLLTVVWFFLSQPAGALN
jgi:hypothetical protein